MEYVEYYIYRILYLEYYNSHTNLWHLLTARLKSCWLSQVTRMEVNTSRYQPFHFYSSENLKM